MLYNSGESTFMNSRAFRRFIISLLLIAASSSSVCGQTNESIPVGGVPVDYFEQLEMPINVRNASIVRKQEKQRLTARVANRSQEAVNGVAFVLIAVNNHGEIVGRLSWVEKLDLEAGELRDVSLRLPKNINMPNRGKFVLGVDEVFGAKSIWITLKLHEAIEAYGAGTLYVQPPVKHVTNTVDSRPS